jgi:type I restriction-modification system DNA methylase subunit
VWFWLAATASQKHFDAHIIEDGFWGQELNHTTYNLARMNMFLHNINYDKFNIQLGDTLRNHILAMTNLLMPSSPTPITR